MTADLSVLRHPIDPEILHTEVILFKIPYFSKLGRTSSTSADPFHQGHLITSTVHYASYGATPAAALEVPIHKLPMRYISYGGDAHLDTSFDLLEQMLYMKAPIPPLNGHTDADFSIR